MLNTKEPAVRKIVVGTDFSVCSNSAFGFAVQLARSQDAEIIGIFVKNMDDLALAIRKELRVNLRSKKMLAKEANSFIRRGFEQLEKKYGQGYAKIRFITLAGEPWSRILKVARKEKADLIVTGTRSRSPLQKLVLGSTAAKLIEHSLCPVVTVGEKCKLPAP